VSDGPYGPLIDTTARIATWNLWWRFGPWEQRAPAILETLRRIDADVVCLQEVWGEGPDTFAARLGDELGMHHVGAARLELDGVDFGNAILSRWPITASDWWPLPAPVELDEHRTLLVADIDGPRGSLQAWCTHLNWRFDHSAVRQEQVRFLAAKVADRRPRSFPPIVCGDLNAAPDSDEIRMLTGRADIGVPKTVFHDAWEVAGDGPGMTWSNDNPYAALDLEPARRIDYVLTGWPRAGGAGHVVSAALVGVDAVDGVVPSDHYGVVVDVRY
jgi:endonuclease/exonuclease/phosphatase family metal-dependent hydrolase